MSTRARRLAVSLLVPGLLFAAGCAADPDDSIASGDNADGDGEEVEREIPRPDELEDLTGEPTVTVEVRDNVFEPRNIIVTAGTEIVFDLQGENAHNVTASVEGAFEQITDPELVAGDASLTLDEPGDYPYYCTFHGTPTVGMTGYLVVE